MLRKMVSKLLNYPIDMFNQVTSKCKNAYILVLYWRMDLEKSRINYLVCKKPSFDQHFD